MIDGIDILCHNLNPKIWFDAPALQGVEGFPLAVIEQTGEILEQPRKAKFNGLTFTVTPSKCGGLPRCYVGGSIHKYYNGGLHNYNDFGFGAIVETVEGLKSSFGIDPNKTTVHGLEIGLNLLLGSNNEVIRVIKSAVAHKGKPYKPLIRSRISGKICEHSQYEIKIYHKGHEGGNQEPILRVEVRIKKMQAIERYGIGTLLDIANFEKVGALLDVLLDAIVQTVFIDPYTNTSTLNDRQGRFLETYRQAERWNNFTREERRNKREQLGRVLKKCNALDVGLMLEKLVSRKWKSLLKDIKEAEKKPTFLPVLKPKEAVEIPTFLPLECLGKNVGIDEIENMGNSNGSELIKKRYCVSCGSDISSQRAGSRFCSEKYKGYAISKKCRNKDSNKRKNLKLKIMQAQIKNQFIKITYKKNGETYTDVIHSSEVAVNREWLETVVWIETVPFYKSDEKEYYYGKEAKAVLEQLTHENAPETYQSV